MLPAGPEAAPASQPVAPAARWGLNTTQIREWARGTEHRGKARGRVPAVLVPHIKAATGQQG